MQEAEPAQPAGIDPLLQNGDRRMIFEHVPDLKDAAATFREFDEPARVVEREGQGFFNEKILPLIEDLLPQFEMRDCRSSDRNRIDIRSGIQAGEIAGDVNAWHA